jgi:hypothetical protein
MPEYDNTNKGALFKNEEKRPDRAMKNPDGTEWVMKDSDYSGEADINGVLHFVDGYLQKSKAGKTYMKLKFKPKQQQHERPKTMAEQEPEKFNDDEDFPF